MQNLGFLLVLVLISGSIQAQTCCSGGVPLSGNLGLPPSNAGTWQLNISHDINVLNTLKAGTETLNDESRKRLTHSTILEAGYSFNDRISIDLFASYVNQVREISRFGNINRASTSGLGDAVLLLKYQVTNTSNTDHSLVVGAGPKFPTGRSDLESNGFTETADLQPGSGAWDGILWGNYIRNLEIRPTMSIFTTATYAVKGKNKEYLGSEEFQFSNEFQALLGVSDRLNVRSVLVDPSIGLRYRNVGQDRQNGALLPNTGGEWIFFVPSVSINTAPNLAFNISTELPVYSKLEGTQLTPTYRINGGILYILKSKKIDIKLP